MSCNINYRCKKCFSCDTEITNKEISLNESRLEKIECFYCGFIETFIYPDNKKDFVHTDQIECFSNITGNKYLVTKWRDLGNGKIEAIEKIKIMW